MNRKNDQLELLAKQCLGRVKENERLLKRLRCLRGMSQSIMLDVFCFCMHASIDNKKYHISCKQTCHCGH